VTNYPGYGPVRQLPGRKYRGRGGAVIHRPGMSWRTGDKRYGTFPTGNQRPIIGYGPDGPFKTYIQDTPPTDAEIGDKWMDTYSKKVFVWNGTQWVIDEAMKPLPGMGPGFNPDDLVIVQPGRGDDLTDLIAGGGQVSIGPVTTQTSTAPIDNSDASSGASSDTSSGTSSGAQQFQQTSRPGIPGFTSLNGPMRYRKIV
jgi:hypothetical protein